MLAIQAACVFFALRKTPPLGVILLLLVLLVLLVLVLMRVLTYRKLRQTGVGEDDKTWEDTRQQWPVNWS